MSGLTDYTARAVLDWLAGRADVEAATSRFLLLYTAAPNDDGTGGTEVSGGNYARVQVAGLLDAAVAWTNYDTNITMAVANPGWIIPGMDVYDKTLGARIGTVDSYVGVTLVLEAAALYSSSGVDDTLSFSAFGPAQGSVGDEPAIDPASIQNLVKIEWPQATEQWGTVVAFGLRDATRLLSWDYLGDYEWMPFTCTAASPGVLTSPSHGLSNGNAAVVTTKYGGDLPTVTGGDWSGVLTVAGVTTDTFTAGVNTISAGDGFVRRIDQLLVVVGGKVSFNAGTLTLTNA